MLCPMCGHGETSVVDSRPSERGQSIRRRRLCEKCDGRFTTFERIHLRDIIVVKSDKRRETFARDKIEKSIRIACNKRPVAEQLIQSAVQEIQQRLERAGEHEVKSRTIGQLVMNALEELDEVAYVRFASVYRDFKEVADFQSFIEQDVSSKK